MAAPRPSTRHRRLVAAAAGLALTVTGVAIAAPSAEAAPLPRTYTAVFSPAATLTPGVATSLTVVVKNTSTIISALDHVVLKVPTGFTATPGTVHAPRGGWNASLNTAGTELTAKTTKALKYGLRKGESLTWTFTATDTVTCDTRGSAAFLPKADGLIVDPYTPQGPPPSVTVAPPTADHFAITSVSDVDPATDGDQVVVATAFDVGVAFLCGSVPGSAPAGSLTLRKVTGAGAVTGAVSVPAGALTATVAGGTYDTVENGVGLSVDSDQGLASVPFSIDSLGAAASSDGSAGQLVVDGAVADLGAGSTGPASLTIRSCVGEAFCTNDVEIDLTGNFKGLYGFGDTETALKPASLTRVCAATDCPHQRPGAEGTENESGQIDYTYNFNCPGGVCAGEGSWYGEREVEEDFTWNTTYVALRLANGSYTDFAAAKRCVPVPDVVNDVTKDAFLHTTGKILNPEAQAAGFCVDVNAITRGPSDGVDHGFHGTLNIPILFVEDPRVRP